MDIDFQGQVPSMYMKCIPVVLQKTQIAIKLMESGIPGGKNQGRSG